MKPSFLLLLGVTLLTGCSSAPTRPALVIEPQGTRLHVVHGDGAEVELAVLRGPGVGALRLEPSPKTRTLEDPYRLYDLHWGSHVATLYPNGESLLVQGERNLSGVHPGDGFDTLLLLADGRTVPLELAAYRSDRAGYLREERWSGPWGDGHTLELRLLFTGEWLVDRRMTLDGEELTCLADGRRTQAAWPPAELPLRAANEVLVLELLIAGHVAHGTLKLASGEQGAFSLRRAAE